VCTKLKNKNGGRTRRGLLFALASSLICPLVYSPSAWPDSGHADVRIVLGSSGAPGVRVAEQLRSKFPGSQIVGDVSALPKHGNFRYIAIGPAALESLLAKDIEDPVFALLVPRLSYREILENTGRGRTSHVTAIYAEASPEAQMHLARRLLKRETRIAVLYSPRTTYLLGLLRNAAAQAGLRVEFILVDDEGLNRALNQASDSAAILAIPDDSIYNAQNIRTILLSTYQRGQPVLGFSTSLVKAGALGTTYSTVEDMVAQVSEQMQEYSGSNRIPAAQYPKYFSVLINDSVSRSLDIVVDDNARKYERKPGDGR
jgi:hypothetical protein